MQLCHPLNQASPIVSTRLRNQYVGGSDQYLLARRAYFVNNEDHARPFVEQQLRDLDRKCRILDVGCGGGNQLGDYSELGFRNLFGIDPSEPMVEASQTLLGDRARVTSGSWESIPFADRFFSAVLGQYSLHYLSELDGAFEESARVLEDGGLLAFVVSHPAFDATSRCRESIDEKMCIRATVYDRQFEIVYFCHSLSDYLSPVFLSKFDLLKIFEFTTAIDEQENVPSGLGIAARRKPEATRSGYRNDK